MKTRIHELRKEKKLSQVQLALEIGTTQTTVSKLEHDLCTLDAELLVRLSQFFHVSADYILYLTNNRLPHSEQEKFASDSRVFHLYHKMSHRQRIALYQFLITLVTENAEDC